MNATTFCDLEDFARSYRSWHGPFSIFVCVFGSVANVLNICVLKTKEMRWPTNLILTGLAVADLLVMIEYLPYAFHRYLSDSKNIAYYSYNLAVFTMFHALFSQVFHFISCVLTVVLAIWRYMTITNPHNSRFWCSLRKTALVILITYVVCPVICSPIFISLKIAAHNQTCDGLGRIIDKKDVKNFTGHVEKRPIFYVTSNEYKTVSFWVYGVVLKFVPCILLTHLSRRLVSILVETKERRKLLLNSGLPLKDVSAEKCIIKKKLDKNKQSDRTSGMLVAVLLLFLLTEFPQAILGLLSAIIGEKFEKQCYNPLGDLMDMLALTNSAINFILYCSMSRQFRSTFRQVFQPKLCQRSPLGQPSVDVVEKTVEKTQFSQA